MFFEAGQITGDGVLDVLQRFRPGAALRNTTGQVRTFCHKHPILIRLNMHTKGIDIKKYVLLQESIDEIGRMLGGWMRSVK